MPHSKLSPSAANRWLACPGSLNHPAPEDAGDNEYTREGTQAHELAEALLLGKAVKLSDYPSDMVEAVQVYVGYCESLEACSVDGTYFVEKRLQSPTIADLGGTVDFATWTDSTLHIVDYKHGANVYVPGHSVQLLIYALLVCEVYDLEPSEIYTTVVQPRCGEQAIRTKQWELEDILSLREQIVNAIASPGKYVAGEHCKWCPHVAKCDHLYEVSLEAATETFEECNNAERWVELLAAKPAIDALIKHAAEELTNYLSSGNTATGAKLVRTSTRRRIKGDTLDEQLKNLKRIGIGKRAATEVKLKTPAALEKEGHNVASVTEQPEGKLVAVLSSDRRRAVEPVKFSELPE